MKKTLWFAGIAQAAIVMIVAVFTHSPARAQESFTVATGDPKGVYSAMFKQFNKVCGKELAMVEQETNGGVKNAELLVGNQVNGTFLQSDLLAFRRATDPESVANVRTLFTLHNEVLHFIARADTKTEGGFIGFGGKDIKFNTIDDLKGRQVGGVGGSVVSGRVVSSQSALGFTMREYANNDAMNKALLSGEVDSILVVGGAPHPLVSALTPQFKLLTVPAATQTKVGGVYSKAKVSYVNLGQAGVDTVSTQAIFATRVYRSKQMQTSLAKLRACFQNELGTIQDTKGTHPAWQSVNAEEKGKWTWYDLQ